MVFFLSNKFSVKDYPLISQRFKMYERHDAETGVGVFTVELKNINDLMSLDALARATNPGYKGLYIMGSTIVLVQKGESAYEYLREGR